MNKRCKENNNSCSNKSYKEGLCKRHFVEKGGTIDVFCSVKNCINKKHAYGLCSGHAHRLRRQGKNFDKITPIKNFKIKEKIEENFPKNGPCSIKSCSNKIEIKGVCEKHYKHFKKHKLKFSFAIQEMNKGCFSCGSFEKLCFDHNHKICEEQRVCEKCYRGVLCRGCNLALGYLEEDKNKINSLILYLYKNTQ